LKAAELMHQYVIKSGLIYGYVFSLGENLEAVSVWLPSQKVYMSLWNFIRARGLSTVIFSKEELFYVDFLQSYCTNMK
jgi:hypothetical protein